jgi:hypothetical protein
VFAGAECAGQETGRLSQLGPHAVRDLFANHLHCCDLVDRDSEQGWGIILEDDAEFDPRTSVGRLRALLEFARSNRAWDMIYLGHYPVAPLFPTRSRNIVRISGSLGAHAYAVHRRFASRVKQIRETDRRSADIHHTDNWYRHLQMRRLVRSYAVFPSFVYQDAAKLAPFFGRADNSKRSQRITETLFVAALPVAGAVAAMAVAAL